MQLRKPLAIVATVTAALLIVGCTGPGSDDSDKSDKTLTIALSTDVQSFDPNMLGDITSLNVMRNIAETLVQVGDGGTLEPLLAESWEAIDDVTWEFHLREGITFHNGEPFDAEAAKFTLDRLNNPELDNARPTRWAKFASFDAVDQYTLRVVTSEPQALTPALLSYVPIVAPAAAEASPEKLASTPIGTGPFVLESWTRDDRMVLTANEDYWQGAPEIDKVVIRPIPETSTRIAELRTGAVDYATNITPALASEIDKADGLSTVAIPGARFVYIGINTEANPALLDPRVRQALNYAVDKQGIITSLFNGNGEIMSQPAHSMHFGFSDDQTPYPYDPQRARDLLSEAGVENLSLNFDSPNGRYLLDAEVAQIVANQLEDVGITVNLTPREWGNFNELNLSRKLGDIFLLGWGNVPGLDADQIYGPLLRTGSSSSYFSNPEMDELVAEASRLTDPQERLDLFAQAAAIAHDQAPWIYLYAQTDIYGISDRVEGLVPGADESLPLYSARIAD